MRAAGAAVLAASLAMPAAGRAAGTTERVGVGQGRAQADPAISAGGRFAALGSRSADLAAGAATRVDIFVRDRDRRTTELVSIGVRGALANGFSYLPSVSAQGRYVAFESFASNLVPGDTNGVEDIFVRDRVAGTTERVSVGPGGAQLADHSFFAKISADGRFVVFESGSSPGVDGVFVHDRRTGATEQVDVGPGGAPANDSFGKPAISAGGRYVAFESEGSNLVPGDTNGFGDVFVRDRLTGTTERVSVKSGGAQSSGIGGSPAISAGGRWVAFRSYDGDLVPGGRDCCTANMFVHDRQTGRTERASVGLSGLAQNGSTFSSPAISANGRFVAFDSDAPDLVPGDTNGEIDIFVRDRAARRTERVSVGPGGAQAIGAGDQGGTTLAISAGGRFVAFDSIAKNLVPGDTNNAGDVFVRDRRTGRTERVSVGPGGVQGDSDSFEPAISPGGRFVAFLSTATNLVPATTDAQADVSVRGR